MATIIVEDGTIVANANSYVSEADLSTYASDRGVTLTESMDVLIIKAMDYVDTLYFAGDKYLEEQALQWPRGELFIYGFEVDYNEIPQLLIDGLCEVAIGIDDGNNPLEPEERKTLMEKVGDIQVEYSEGSRTYTYLRTANAKLKRLVKTHFGSTRV